MKLVIGGSTGFVGTELVRQARRRGCMTVAATPSKLKTTSLEDATKISRDYAIKTLASLRHNHDRPLRFVYVSGHFAPRSLAEVPKELLNHELINYALMRGEAEARILEYARQSNGAAKFCAAKPGVSDALNREKQVIPGIPNIELASALLDQVVNGFERDTLMNDDMIIRLWPNGEKNITV